MRDALKHFYAMNDVENGVNWAKIVRLMPRAKKEGSDRAPAEFVRVGVYPRLIQRIEARMLELLGSAGSVVLMQEGETYMATIIEAVETKCKPMSKRDSINILTEELQNTGWGDSGEGNLTFL